MSEEQHSHNCSAKTVSNVHQTLDELDFERGIWPAAHSNDLERVKKLISCGENVDRLDNSGYTALHYASRNGHLSVCEYLLTSGACVNALTRAGQASSLHRASTTGKYHIVELLLNKEANRYLQDADGKTALHRAAENGHKDVYNLLIAKAPDLNAIKDNKGKLASDYL